METRVNKIKELLIVTSIILLVLSAVLIVGTQTVKNKLDKEKIISESLLSEKLKLDESLAKFKKDLNSLTGRNTQLDQLVTETSRKLQIKETEINKLLAEQASVGKLRKKIAELEALKEQLNKDLANANITIARLKNENDQVNEQMALLEKENEVLTNDNTILMAMVADNYRIEALRGKRDKPTINARRTNKLMVSFDIPASIGNGIYFRIKTPEGQEISSKTDLLTSMRIIDNDDDLLVSASQKLVGEPGLKRVEMEYKPLKKLAKGVYKFNVYNDEKYLGSTQLRLK